jgi:hypothetical protein
MKHDHYLKKLNIDGFVTQITQEIKKKRNMILNETIRLTWNRHGSAVSLE